MAAEKLKVPGEEQKTQTNVPFSSPGIQTAADVRQSSQVTGGNPAPATSSPSVASVPTAPATQTTSSVIPSAPTAGKTGGTLAPAPTTPTASTPAAATVPTTTGAPPGVPNTAPPPTVGLPPTLKSVTSGSANQQQWEQAQNENKEKLYEAALAYNGGPDAALPSAQREAATQLKSATGTRGAAGTIDSSLFGEDKTKIGETQAVADLKAYNTYQAALNNAQDALTKAHAAYIAGTEQEKREMAEQAEREQPKTPLPQAAPAPQRGPNGGVIEYTGPPGAGGVRPYIEHLPNGGMVRVGGR